MKGITEPIVAANGETPVPHLHEGKHSRCGTWSHSYGGSKNPDHTLDPKAFSNLW